MTTTETGRTAPPGRFFATMPGILTAIAALVTAVGGVYGAYLASHQQPVAPPAVIVTAARPDASPVAPARPDAADDTAVPEESTIQDATDALAATVDEDGSAWARWYASLDVDSQTVVDDCDGGDSHSCAAVASTLITGCDTGDFLACDAVYEIADVGSDLEDFGATCGWLFEDWTYAAECSA